MVQSLDHKHFIHISKGFQCLRCLLRKYSTLILSILILMYLMTFYDLPLILILIPKLTNFSTSKNAINHKGNGFPTMTQNLVLFYE